MIRATEDSKRVIRTAEESKRVMDSCHDSGEGSMLNMPLVDVIGVVNRMISDMG